MNNSKKNRNAFILGAALYFVIWFLSINFDETPWDFDCCEASCYFLLSLSFPFSMGFARTTLTVTYGTLITGSILCGLVMMGISSLGRLIFKRNNDDTYFIEKYFNDTNEKK